jgi:hypothetical protein
MTPVVEAAEQARHRPSQPAPAPLPGRPALLAQSVAGVSSPGYTIASGPPLNQPARHTRWDPTVRVSC